MVRLPSPYESFQKLAECALSKWAPDAAQIKIIPLKAGGHSGAAVVKIDISQSSGSLESGQYILKLSSPNKWADQETEIVAHSRAEAWNEAFSSKHIPKLRDSFSDSSLGFAMLYEIAGMSLDSHIATDVRESPGFLQICGVVVQDLLQNWTNKDPTCELSPAGLLKKWLGYRLDPAEAPKLFALGVSLSSGQDSLLPVYGETLPNPLKFYDFASHANWSERPIIEGLQHCDLHGGNILVHRRNPYSQSYWVIDFALSTVTASGFDLAYLECAQILYCLGDSDPALALQVLRLLDQPPEHRLVPAGTKWLLDVLTTMRGALTKWIDHHHPRRADDLNRQMTLARIAAGLNWANKPLGDSHRAAAMYYAGWAAKQYLAFEPDSEQNYWNWARVPKNSLAPPATDNASSNQLWEEVWEATNGFAPSAGRLIVVAEALRDFSDLGALGQLPLAAIIDLDPQSDDKGLYTSVHPVLEARRSVHTSSGTFGPIDFTRGTAWMMAAGWLLRSEQPTDFPRWKYQKLESIRGLLRNLEAQTSPDRIIVLSFAGGALDSRMPLARLEQVLDAVDEVCQGRSLVFHIGATPCSARIQHRHIPIDLKFFTLKLTQAFGCSSSSMQPEVPAKDRTSRILSLDALRAMEENFHVLHSLILNGNPVDSAIEDDSFWRGNPPTWFDLHSGIDILREPLLTQVTTTLRQALEAIRNKTVVLHHTPGSGGTTLALRVAWDLRIDHPVAILRRNSPALPDRLQDLYNKTETPVLLVAEASLLGEAAREDLYREMQQRNVRVVCLYIRRVFQPPKDGLFLADPMSQQEARRFADSYKSLTGDPFRRVELERITTEKDLERYRAPFFYGLTTFERDFKGAGTYVANHTSGVRGKRRDVLEYLALVTIYSNSGLHEIFLRRLLGLTDASAMSLTEALGEGPARLVVRRNGLHRLMHQVLAEEALEDFQGRNWRLELKTLSTDFISDLSRHVGQASTAVTQLLRQMFVDRQDSTIDDVEDRQKFSELVETLDQMDNNLGHIVLRELTEQFPNDPHFWNHLGRHQIYRLKRDLDKAEEYLVHATSLSPDDFIHHHTLGLVRRYRVQQILRSAAPATSISDLILLAKPMFDSASRAFERTREINQDNVYGYITHIQMILDVVAKLKQVSAVRTIAQLPDDSQQWVQDHIADASELIGVATELYGTLDRTDTYLDSCIANLQKLYDNLDDVIQVWEVAQERNGGSHSSRRALAHAYLDRSEGRWSSLSDPELRRIVEMIEGNLRGLTRRDDDYRLWFEAYKLLPDFDIDEALARLRIWAERFPTWRAYFYLYAIHFHLWFVGRTTRTDEFDEALEQCQKLAFGRRNYSHSWLGFSPANCPLLAAVDLGEWDKKKNFWSSTQGLRRINGIVDVIHGQQAGYVLIDGRVRAFFVPMSDFSANNDENKKVSFYLGFSASGLRAWSVTRGWVAEGTRTGAPAVSVEVFEEKTDSPSEELKKQRIRTLQRDKVTAFIQDWVRAKCSLGIAAGVNEAVAAAEACFGVEGLLEHIGYTVGDLLPRERGFELADEEGRTVVLDLSDVAASATRHAIPNEVRGGGQVFRIDHRRQIGLLLDEEGAARVFRRAHVRRGQWPKLKDGCVVDFVPDQTSQALAAIDIHFLGDGDIGDLVRRKSLEIIERASNAGLTLTKKELTSNLKSLFDGAIPGVSQSSGLESLLRSLDGVTFVQDGANRVLKINASRATGKLRGDQDRSKHTISSSTREDILEDTPQFVDVDAVKAEISNLLKSGNSMFVAELGEKLASRFPGKISLAKRLGVSKLSAFLRRHDFNVSQSPQGSLVVSLKVEAPSKQAVPSKKRKRRNFFKGPSH